MSKNGIINKIVKKLRKKIPWWHGGEACKCGGDPVDLISGNVVYDTIDFELPGPIPLQWRRIWCSANQVVGHLGHGTRYNYEMGLEVLEEELAVIVFLNDGRACIFPDIIIETIGNITDEAVQKYIKEQAEESRKEDSRSTAL